MEAVTSRAEELRTQSLLNFQAMGVGRDAIPVAGCSAEGNPHVLSRCLAQKVYDNRSNVTPATAALPPPQDSPVEPYEG